MNISLSNIWKSFILFILGLVVLKWKFNYGIQLFDKIILLLLLSFFINANGFFNFLDVEEIFVLSILPISYYIFYFLYSNQYNKLELLILILSSFLVLTALPFILGIITPPQILDYSLEDFGRKYDNNNLILVGFFKHPSISSKVFVFCAMIIWALGIKNIKIKIYQKTFLVLLFFIALLSIYLSFTRTGWIMFLIFMLFYNFYGTTSKIKYLLFILIFLFSMYYFFESNQAIKNRIFGITIDSQDKSYDVSTISSGRDELFYRYFSLYQETNILTLLIGFGKERALYLAHGAAAHNRILEIYGYGGLISVCLYLYYLFLLYKEIKKCRTNDNIYILTFSAYIIMVLSILPSHGLPIYSDIIFGGIIALNRINYEIGQKN